MKFVLSVATVSICLTCVLITLLTILPSTSSTEITVQSLDVPNDVGHAIADNQDVKVGYSIRTRKPPKKPRRQKKKNRRAKRARLLRNEQLSFMRTQGSQALGLQWVVDIRRNLSTLMKGLEQMEQQLTAVKEQLQQKNAVPEGQPQGPGGSEVPPSPTPSVVCPWEMLNGGQFNKCYSFHNNDRRSWYQAAASCRLVGSRLLRISSAHETAFLLSRAPAWMSSGTAWLTTTWTDGNRLYPCPKDGNSPWPSETSWGWGTRLDRQCFDQLVGDRNNKNPIKVYTDWLPADAQAGACVALAVASTNWEALDCDRPAAYVCERDPVQIASDLPSNDAENVNSAKITAEQEGEEDERVADNSVPEDQREENAIQPVVSDETTKGAEDGGEENVETNDYSNNNDNKTPSDAKESVKIAPEEA